ncbi:MAG: hypothetical protein GX558_11190 [Clostridiales bacterium]|nr:hypothetical protein [Clostridiales bacterium]
MRKYLALTLALALAMTMLAGITHAESEEPVVLVYHRSGGTDAAIDPDNETYKRLRQAALEQANVDLQIELFDWGDNYRQTLMMHAAAGDLPSGVWTLGGVMDSFATEMIDNMGMAGMIYDWTDVVNDVENYPTLKANAEETFIQMAICKQDGKLYGLPAERHGSYPHAPGGVTIRKDWLLSTGLDFPQTEEELYDIIVAFRNSFKSDSGAEIAPVSFPQWSNFTFWLNSWMGSCMWVERDGQWNYGKYADQEGLTKALTFLNRLWREGLLDRESFSQTNEQFITKGSTGGFGVTTFDYGTVYSINDSFYAAAPDSDMFFVSAPTFSANADLSAENVNSCEITSVPFNRTVITTNGIDEETFKKLAKAIDWIGTYDASLMLLMGFEGSEWELEQGTDRKIRTAAWTENVSRHANYQYNAGLCYWSSLNSNIGAMYDLLAAICVRKSDIESVGNIKGHQIAVSDPMNIVAAGAIESEKGGLIEDAWKKMVIAAVSADTADGCRAALDAWPSQLEVLGYQEIVAERIASCEAYGLSIN